METEEKITVEQGISIVVITTVTLTVVGFVGLLTLFIIW